jgi:hypothetical protein
MGQSTRFNDAKKTGSINYAAIGIDDNPIVREESSYGFCIILDHGLAEFFFQLSYFFNHLTAPSCTESRHHHREHDDNQECLHWLTSFAGSHAHNHAALEQKGGPGLHEYLRQDNDPPAAIARNGWRYHHVGIPTQTPRPDEIHVPHLHIHVAGFQTSPFGVEWMRFDPDAPYPEAVKTIPHVAFEVDERLSVSLGGTAWTVS